MNDRHDPSLPSRTVRRVAAAALLAIAGLGAVSTAGAAPVFVDIRVAPPPPRVEVIPAARSGHVWAPGYWEWRRNRHHWVGGRYIVARPGYVYAGPTWVQRGPNWRYQPGAWARGDRDRDGVPNRFDRHPGNPYRR